MVQVSHPRTWMRIVVSSAVDAPSGIELARQLDVDLVLLDLVLPGGHGLEVLEAIRAMKPRLPVIAFRP